MENEDDITASFCLSFSSYTGDRIAETAERVRLEFSKDNHCDDEFEFVNLQSNCEAVWSSSGDCDLVFPIFDQILITKTSAVKSDVKPRLRDLFLHDNEEPSYSSSSSSDEEEEENELNGISREIQCPRTPEKSVIGGWRKSKSTGSSQRWRIKDLLKRSYSEGKQSISLMNPNATNREEDKSSNSKKSKKVSALEKFYMKNKAMKEEEKRKSYLPYKKNLLLFFFNIHL